MAESVNVAASCTTSPAGDRMMTDDQCFLLTVILGVYFGPHLKGETPPHKSAMQRVRERLPPYTLDQLAGSTMKVLQIMHVYYHILRKASEAVVLAPSCLLHFFQDTLPAGLLRNYPRFINLFPTDLHRCSFVEDRFMMIHNIVFIDKPSTTYLREEVVARFKSLTGLQEFVLEKDAAKLPIYVTDEAFYEVIGLEALSKRKFPSFVPPYGSHGRKRKRNEAIHVMPRRMGRYERLPTSASPFSSGERDTYFKGQLDPKVVFSPLSTADVQCSGAAVAWSAGVEGVGNVDVGLSESITGCVNLSESKDCYLFQVSLPGVRRDQTFSWELDMSGKVLIEGETTTGGKAVESGTRNVPPPGHFSLSFQLPGRVDPKRSNCNFGSDGIFEGVVKKLMDKQ